MELLQEYERFAPQGVCVPAESVSEVLQAAARGTDAEEIYYIGEKTAEIVEIIGKCRMIANDLEELRRIDAAARTAGQLQKVGLRMVPEEFDDGLRPGVRFFGLAELAREAKKLDGVTVRGCFVNGRLDGLHGKELGRYFRACYNCAKQMTVVLPCAMPYLCAENALAALDFNQTAHPETLEDCLRAAQIVAMQNETAFYARLFIK